ncbi:hypothetical protein M427DRAFT_55272 [Gonapodya prolifera JEL478]|uniref:Uncharacterized protein n=1 Tax=Gonapodya prolifera (strain JEL478) TaxID=1344416 RepID=A0A139AIS8_GONPJ|nr:hypothetical protein M427DRAFT_55272 [Gonapodya prolifera JEL478]|eukprot:KXS16619.1 hypothetical protein M427DRAFT_55272 [Gonapodya prolifera JEL478]
MAVKENFVAQHPPSYYASLYKTHTLPSPHCILLGATPANTQAAQEAFGAYPRGIQVGAGVNADNAAWCLQQAEKVIVTSWLFPGGKFDKARLKRLEGIVGKDKLVVDVSCRRVKSGEGEGEGGKQWVVAMNKWQTLTDMECLVPYRPMSLADNSRDHRLQDWITPKPQGDPMVPKFSNANRPSTRGDFRSGCRDALKEAGCFGRGGMA